MGIDIYSAKFLKNEVKRGLGLGQMLTLGHQAVYMEGGDYHALVTSLGIPCRDTLFADEMFSGLGARSVDVMDASDYEGANILHNLNEPVGPELSEKYDVVFDGGALEHVFNFSQALKNCMEMVKIGGCFITVTPANAFCGHGFYQFSPELFYSALSEKNGYVMERMLFVHRGQWYSVRNPADVKQRIQLLTCKPTLLFVSARRRDRKKIFAEWPQQSDYAAIWSEAKQTLKPAVSEQSFKEAVLKFCPPLKKIQIAWRNYKQSRSFQPTNRTWFIPINLD